MFSILNVLHKVETHNIDTVGLLWNSVINEHEHTATMFSSSTEMWRIYERYLLGIFGYIDSWCGGSWHGNLFSYGWKLYII